MKILLDTHALLWSLDDDQRLGQWVRDAITSPDNGVMVSLVSLWEITVKVRTGKLQIDLSEISGAIDQQGFHFLNIKPSHLIALGELPFHTDHRDPFDHLLIAQAVTERAVFVSENRHATRYPIQVLTCSDP